MREREREREKERKNKTKNLIECAKTTREEKRIRPQNELKLFKIKKKKLKNKHDTIIEHNIITTKKQ